MNNSFENLGLSREVLSSIDNLGYKTPSEIQREIIPVIIDGYDVIGQAQTGTGKTLAFAASVLSKINVKKDVVQAIILTPTRELAIQVCSEFKNLNKTKEFNITAVYGGDSIDRQIKDLKKGADVVVGTPGRVQDLIKRKKLNLSNISFFVLDEADEMLNMGFLEDIENVLKCAPENKQILLFSATMPKNIKMLAASYMNEEQKHIEVKSKSKTSDNIEQFYTFVNDKHRLEVLCRNLDLHYNKRCIVFCHTKKECDELVGELQSKNYSIETLHGDISQATRTKTLERFKKGSFNVLIATDIAARGIHVDNIDLVVNFKVPREVETYVHRIGRTGRASNKGISITLLTHKEKRKLELIEKHTKSKMTEKSVPTAEEVVSSRYNLVIEKAKEVTHIEEAYEYIRDLNKAELMDLCAGLIKFNINKTIGSNIYKPLEIKDKSNSKSSKKVDPSKARMFITIGTKDGLRKNSLLELLNKETKLPNDVYSNVEILNTFTFVDVDKDSADEFMRKIKGKVYKGRKIRVEISSKTKKR